MTDETTDLQLSGLENAKYQKSSFCGGGTCIEIAFAPNGTVLVRDNKDATQAPLYFSLDEWKAFTLGVKNGEFDIPHL